MKSLELFIERVILASRWLLVIFYIGLAIALALYAVSRRRAGAADPDAAPGSS